MKKILFVVLLTIPTMLFAQQFEDVVTLRNGSVIRGVIIDRVPNESIRLQTSDGNIFAFSYDEIQTLGREVGGRNVQRRNQREVGTFNRPRGYMGEVILGAGTGNSLGINITNVSFSVINGFRFLPQFAMGLGIGFESSTYSIELWYDGNRLSASESRNRIPVFLHLRSDFLDGRVSPFVVINSGYSVGDFGGAFGEFILGCSFNVGQRNRMSIGLGSKSFNNDWGGSITTIGLNVGFSW